jgi:hypothetical protein
MFLRGRRGRNHVVLSPQKLQVRNLFPDNVYSIQHYVIKFVSGRLLYPVIAVSSTNRTDRHNVTVILLKVALNTITLIPNPVYEIPIVLL